MLSNDTPVMNETYEGTSGRTQGLRNENSTARKAVRSEILVGEADRPAIERRELKRRPLGETPGGRARRGREREPDHGRAEKAEMPRQPKEPHSPTSWRHSKPATLYCKLCGTVEIEAIRCP